MNMLLHVCCGVCAGPIVQKYREVSPPPASAGSYDRPARGQAGAVLAGYFYNPNIHPFQEFQKRLDAVEILGQTENITIYYERSYGLAEFLEKQMTPKGGVAKKPQRCLNCYEMRLGQTARFAKEHGFEAFTSTLCISPYQDQAAIKDIGEKAAQANGVRFVYETLTNLFPRCKEMAKEHNLYRQQYCGCIFSEYERYK